MPGNAHSEFVITRSNGAALLRLPGAHGRFVDRPALRAALLDGARVHFSKRLASYDECDHGVTARFEDGTQEVVDVLLGADGANSAVVAGKHHRGLEMSNKER